MLILLLAALSLVVLSGLAAFAAGAKPRLATALGAGGAFLGCAAALVPAGAAMLGEPAGDLRLAWGMPGGSLDLSLDALSGLFLIPTLLLSALAAVYGAKYLADTREPRRLGAAWFSFNLLVASMALVIVARNAVLFLVAWETMALASFFLVAYEREKAAVRDAAWTYFIATHLGTAFLLAMFVAWGAAAGSLDFDRMAAAAGGMSPAFAGTLFALALVGFGTKAGFMPLHVWLPDAHPAAPSHVSALMSGVMIKTGIYGLVRALTMLGTPPAWWGWTLVAVGATSGILGVLFALAQHNLKRLLAYHSVENIGIIALGLGLGLLGVSYGLPALAALGFAGGLLHVLNHAMFKGLLFLGAGSVLHASGTREMDHLGGLLKRMPWTGATFLVGAAAISGLPPLNGFVSEFLIYLGALGTVVAPNPTLGVVVPALAAAAALALIGGLAAACFTKAFGVVFLGEPRSEHAAHAHESGGAMIAPMVVLAVACALVGVLPALVLRAMGPVVAVVLAKPAAESAALLAPAASPLVMISIVAAIFAGLVIALVIVRRALLAGRPVEETGTWDCGYARPTARMEYTSSSYAQPLTSFFRAFLGTKERVERPAGVFPRAASFASETLDVCRERFFGPVFAAVASALGRLAVLQHGRVQSYVLYVVLALLALLIWKMG